MSYAFITDEQRLVLLANGRESLQNPDFDPRTWSSCSRRMPDPAADRD